MSHAEALCLFYVFNHEPEGRASFQWILAHS